MPALNKGKGKARAESASETSPLLSGPSGSAPQPEQVEPRRPSRLRSILITAGIVLFSLGLSALLFILLLAASYRPSPSQLESLPRTAFRYTPPDSVSVLKLDDDGLLLNVSLRCGIDADRALGIRPDDPERDQGAAWWEALRRWTAYRVLPQLPSTVEVKLPAPLLASLDHDASVSLRVLDAMPIPIIPGADLSDEWLKPISFTVLGKPEATSVEWWELAKGIWAKGHVAVSVTVPTALATYPLPWLSRNISIEKEDLKLGFDVPLPRLPGLPRPGKPLDPASLVKLKGYTFRTEDSGLFLSAVATVPNVAPSLNTTVPFALPFRIGIPGDRTEQQMATVITRPLSLDGAETISLEIFGKVSVDLRTRGGGNSSSLLSDFFQRYLQGEGNPIVVHGLESLPSFAHGAEAPPSWLLSLLPQLSVPLVFPGPSPPPKVIHSVNIEKMHLSESGGKMLASGTVIAEIDLPPGMEHVTLDVRGVRPDVLVYDGPAGEDPSDEEYPPRAFGRIHPEEWLEAESRLSDNPFFPYRLVVTAPLENVPLDVLPGRDRVLSGFVSKIVFKGGALAGIKGKASVQADIVGIGGTVRLDNLPVLGSTWVGRH